MTDEQSGEADLRRRVDELEATVRGLTQELVEANERIHQLEDELEEDDPDFIEADDDGAETSSEDPNAGVTPETQAETETDEVEEEEDEGEDDIIVA